MRTKLTDLVSPFEEEMNTGSTVFEQRDPEDGAAGLRQGQQKDMSVDGTAVATAGIPPQSPQPVE